MKILVQMRGDKKLKTMGNVPDLQMGRAALEAIGADWSDSKKGRSFKVDGTEVRFLYSDKKLAGIGMVDTDPAPAVEPDKQPMRVRVAK